MLLALVVVIYFKPIGDGLNTMKNCDLMGFHGNPLVICYICKITI